MDPSLPLKIVSSLGFQVTTHLQFSSHLPGGISSAFSAGYSSSPQSNNNRLPQSIVFGLFSFFPTFTLFCRFKLHLWRSTDISSRNLFHVLLLTRHPKHTSKHTDPSSSPHHFSQQQHGSSPLVQKLRCRPWCWCVSFSHSLHLICQEVLLKSSKYIQNLDTSHHLHYLLWFKS